MAWVYVPRVVSMSEWPKSACAVFSDSPVSCNSVAWVCRNECHDTRGLPIVSQAGVAIRQRGTRSVCRRRHTKGAHRGTQSGDGDFYGSANRDWWWHVARCTCQPNADGASGRYLCCCCASLRRRSSGRICFALSGLSDDDRGRIPVLLAASYGDISRMAFTRRTVAESVGLNHSLASASGWSAMRKL